MTIENGGFDAGAMFDEGVEEAEEAGFDMNEVVIDSPDPDDSANVIEVESTVPEAAAAETKPAQEPSADEVQAAIDSTKEAEQDEESIIALLLPKPATEAAQTKTDFKPGSHVPVEDHIKLRQRAQAAEREAEELRQRLETSTTQTGGAKPGEEVEKSPLEKFVEENPDEDIVPPKVQLEDRRFHEAKQQKAQQAQEQAARYEREKQEKQDRQSQAIQTFTMKATQSEVEFRKANPDFNAVVKPIVEAGLLTDTERIDMYKAANPAQKLYDICKAKTAAIRSAAGLPAQNAPKTETTKAAPKTGDVPAAEEGEELTDDQIYEEVKDLLPAQVEDEN